MKRYIDDYLTPNGTLKDEFKNREALQSALAHEHHAAIMVDIDHFKSINDTYGHSFGDMVLKEFAARIKTILHETEVFARVGGEEFVIFIPHVQKEAAILLAERIRAAVRSLPFDAAQKKLTITASLGINMRRTGWFSHSLWQRSIRHSIAANGRDKVSI